MTPRVARKPVINNGRASLGPRTATGDEITPSGPPSWGCDWREEYSVVFESLHAWGLCVAGLSYTHGHENASCWDFHTVKSRL